MDQQEDLNDSSNISNWTSISQQDADFDELFISNGTMTLTLVDIDMLMEELFLQQQSCQTTEPQMTTSSSQTPELPIKYKKSLSPQLLEDHKSPISTPDIHQLDKHALMKSIAEKSLLALGNNEPLARIDLENLIIVAINIWTEEDRQKLLPKLLSIDIIGGDIRPDFFSDNAGAFWKQFKVFEKHIFSNEFIKYESDDIKPEE